jgi:hypothetical protein
MSKIIVPVDEIGTFILSVDLTKETYNIIDQYDNLFEIEIEKRK